MPTAKLTRSAPYFPVTDVARAVAHYQGVFGFTTEYSAGSPAEFAIVTRDGFSIMLRRVADAGPISPNERQGGTWDVFFWVSAVRALHAVPIAIGIPASERALRFRFATSRATLYRCAAGLARMACCASGFSRFAIHSRFAWVRKSESEKKSGVVSYTNVETSRMSVGLTQT